MKRLLTFFLICFSFVEYTRAEDIINYKYWDEGKLTWDDFQDTLSLKGVPSAFNAFLRIEKTEKRDGNTRTIRPEAQACFDKRHSFADRQIQNENLLRLFQLKYDLLEMYRRRLQTELNLGVVGYCRRQSHPAIHGPIHRTKQKSRTRNRKRTERDKAARMGVLRNQRTDRKPGSVHSSNLSAAIRIRVLFRNRRLLPGRKHCRLLGSRLANQCRIRFSLCQYTSALRLFCRNSPYPSGNYSFQRTNHGYMASKRT